MGAKVCIETGGGGGEGLHDLSIFTLSGGTAVYYRSSEVNFHNASQVKSHIMSTKCSTSLYM